MSFRVGMKVVCVDDRLGIYPCTKGRRSLKEAGLARGNIYTIADIVLGPETGMPCLVLDEMKPADGNQIRVRAERFRPVHTIESDAALFKSLLTPEGVFRDALMRMDLP